MWIIIIEAIMHIPNFGRHREKVGRNESCFFHDSALEKMGTVTGIRAAGTEAVALKCPDTAFVSTAPR